MKWGAGLVCVVVLIFACSRSNPIYSGLLPGESCSQVQQCSRGTYSVCQLGNSCRYLASDGTSFSCGSCQSCTGGLLAIGQWCLAGGTSNGGNTTGVSTNGGNTTGVSTNGGNTTGVSTNGGSTNGGSTNGFTSGGTSGGFTNGTSGGSSGGGTTGTGDACTTCENQVLVAACSGPASTCQNDSNCANLITCLQGCFDTTCEQNCANTAGGPAVTEFNDVGDCICNNCSSSCSAQCSTGTTSTGGSSGGSTGTSGTSGGQIGGLIGGLTGGIIGGLNGTSGGSSGGTTGSIDVCNTCEDGAFSGTCKTQFDACNAVTTCVTVWNCVNTCTFGDSACINTCVAGSTATTLAKYNAVAQCICSTACSSQCSNVLPQCS